MNGAHNLKIKDGKINFKCCQSNCKHTCCGPFSGISQELKSLDNRPFDEIVLTPEDYERISSSGFENFTEKAVSPVTGKEYYRMALEKNGTCKAFVDGKCSIYKVSPTLCKAFPFYYDMFAGLCAISCEGFSDDVWVDLEDIEPFLNSAKKMYQFWLDFYSKD